MSQITRTYSFTDGSTAYGSQVESEILNIVTVWNNHDSAASNWTSFGLTGNAAIGGTLGVTGASTFTGGVVSLFGYRRPNLVFIGVTAVDVENNTGTANQTTIVFPDGTIRSVTEDTSSTNKYRRFLITAAAEFTSGTEDSGVRSGISEATNTWYAIYAVKSTINTSNFVLAGDTTLPLQANFATLNSRYGTSGWVYLGMIRNGDNDGATGDILKFSQSCGTTRFNNNANSIATGVKLAATSGYTYSAGTGTADIPNHLAIVYIHGAFSSDAAADFVINVGSVSYYKDTTAANKTLLIEFLVPIAGSISGTGTGSGTEQFQYNISGWIDPILNGAYTVL